MGGNLLNKCSLVAECVFWGGGVKFIDLVALVPWPGLPDRHTGRGKPPRTASLSPHTPLLPAFVPHTPTAVPYHAQSHYCMICPIFLPHSRLYEVVLNHMCVLRYIYRTIFGVLLTLMKLCEMGYYNNILIMGAGHVLVGWIQPRPVHHTLTWVVRPMFCMGFNI